MNTEQTSENIFFNSENELQIQYDQERPANCHKSLGKDSWELIVPIPWNQKETKTYIILQVTNFQFTIKDEIITKVK